MNTNVTNAINSIPSDYIELVNDVNRVKSDLNDVTVETKNILRLIKKTYNVNGVNITLNDNNTLYLSGSNTSGGGRTLKATENFILQAGTYCISLSGGSNRLIAYVNDAITNDAISHSEEEKFTLTEEKTVYVGFGVFPTLDYNDYYNIQLEVGENPFVTNDENAREEILKTNKNLEEVSSKVESNSKSLIESGLIKKSTITINNAKDYVILDYTELKKGVTYNVKTSCDFVMPNGISFFIYDENGTVLYTGGGYYGNTFSILSYTPSEDVVAKICLRDGGGNYPKTYNIELYVDGLDGSVNNLKNQLNFYAKKNYFKNKLNCNIIDIPWNYNVEVFDDITLDKAKTYRITINKSNQTNGTITAVLKNSDGIALMYLPLSSDMDSIYKEYTNKNYKIDGCSVVVFASQQQEDVEIIFEEIDPYNNFVEESAKEAFMRFCDWYPEKEKFVFPIITDTHMCFGEKRGYPFVYSSEILNDLFRFDFIAHLGDIGYDMAYDESNNMQDERMKFMVDFISKCYGKSASPFLFAKGNHECYFKNNGYSQAIIKNAFQVSENRKYKSMHLVDGKMYGYYDFDNRKTRVIFLDANDVRDINDRSYTNGWSKIELEWLRDILTTTPYEYNVILISHKIPHWKANIKINESGEWRDPTESDFETFDAEGHEILLSMLKAYKAKSSGTATSYIDAKNETVSFDFSNSNGELIGIFGGHVHFDAEIKEDNVLMVTTQGTGYLESEKVPSWGVNSGVEPTCVDIVAVCFSERKIKIFRVGAGGSQRDREISY